ncbi:MAG: energy transducer TonB [Bacteroidota bacterium]
MKSIFLKAVMLFFLGTGTLGFSQNNLDTNVDFEVSRIYPYLSITTQALRTAEDIKDLDRLFKPSWVREYFSVKITALQNGTKKTAWGKNNTLTKQQKELMIAADKGTDIFVKVRYLPNNSLRHNDPKVHNFTFSVDPDQPAEFVGGHEKLMQYLRQNAIEKIPNNSFEKYDLTAVTFTVNEKGEIEDTRIFDAAFQPYDNKIVNELLIDCIKKMPNWNPATYADGTKVKQTFAFSVGNMESCVANLLNTRRFDNEE